jgi:hypothetical protein
MCGRGARLFLIRPKSLSARIIVELYPRTCIGLASLLQGQGEVAKWAPAAGIEEVRFCRFKGISSNFHRIAMRVYFKAVCEELRKGETLTIWGRRASVEPGITGSAGSPSVYLVHRRPCDRF